ncbi:phosphatase PAP2 family protein [Candidatus Gracilibacteria bacterium]|nr:phosphatase PAP2 family protein [Candidatus Gracilibacteria bacterium]
MKIVPEKLSKINFTALKRELWFWVGFGLFLYALGRLLDHQIFTFIENYVRHPELDHYIIFLTEKLIWWVLILFGVVTGYRAWTNPDNKTKLLPALFAMVVTGILAFTLKSLFDIPRPFAAMDVIPLVQESTLSFPSAHAAISFALFIPFYRISKRIGIAWLLFALLIGVARVYENVHYPSDIAGGIFLGGIIGSYFSHPETKKVLNLLWQELEFRRQSFHFVAGFLVVFAHWAGFLRLRWIAVLLGVGLLISYISQHRKLPFIHWVLQLFDRPRDKNFPGRGAFYFLLGVFLTFFLFQGGNIRIAYASILILSVGDSLNRLFSSRIPGRFHFPWNPRKNCLGVAIGVAIGTFAAQFFVPIAPAFLGSSFAIMAETVPWRLGRLYIDDNISVPLIAGGVMWVLM